MSGSQAVTEIPSYKQAGKATPETASPTIENRAAFDVDGMVTRFSGIILSINFFCLVLADFGVDTTTHSLVIFRHLRAPSAEVELREYHRGWGSGIKGSLREKEGEDNLSNGKPS